MIQRRMFYLDLAICFCFGLVNSTCIYPWGAGPWTDSFGRTAITFTTSTMQGYGLSYRGSDVSSWSCLYNNTSLFLSRSSSINVAGDNYYLYVCMLVNTISANKFYYHLMTDIHPNIIVTGTSTAVRSTVRPTTDSVSDICVICAQNPTSISLPVSDYTVMTDDGTATTLGGSPSFGPNPCDPTTTTTTRTQPLTKQQETTSQAQVTETIKASRSAMTDTSESVTNYIVGGTVGAVVVVVVVVTGVVSIIKKKGVVSERVSSEKP